MKAEGKFFVKAIYLILVLIVTSLIINRIVSLNVASIEEREGLKFTERALDILEVLSGSEKCLSYKETGKIENRDVRLTTHKVLDKKKLDDFQTKYSDIEPSCSRDSDYNYRVKVTTFPVDISTSMIDTTRKTIDVNIDSQTWEFGSTVFSEDDAFEKNMTISTPVIVYYDASKFLPGIMTVSLVSGDMERIVGFVEESCSVEGRSSTTLFLHYPTHVEETNGKNYLCMDFSSGKKCQRLNCEKLIEFDSTQTPGNYIFVSISDNNKLKVTT